MRYRSILECSALLIGLWARAAAQTLPLDAMQQVNGSSRVRVRLASGEWETVYRPVVDSESLSYSASGLIGQGGRVAQLPPPLPVARIAQIQVPHGSHALVGGKIGAGIGCALSLLAIAVASGDSWTSPTGAEAGRAIVTLTLIGGGVGALIGSASPRWRTVYGAPAP